MSPDVGAIKFENEKSGKKRNEKNQENIYNTNNFLQTSHIYCLISTVCFSLFIKLGGFNTESKYR